MLERFRQRHAAEVAGWAATPEEARWWGGHATQWPVDAGAGFAPVTPDERRRFNEGQPVAYAWLRRELP